MNEKIEKILNIVQIAFLRGSKIVSVFVEGRDRPVKDFEYLVVAENDGSLDCDNPLLKIDRETLKELQDLNLVTTYNSYGGFNHRKFFDFYEDRVKKGYPLAK